MLFQKMVHLCGALMRCNLIIIVVPPTRSVLHAGTFLISKRRHIQKNAKHQFMKNSIYYKLMFLYFSECVFSLTLRRDKIWHCMLICGSCQFLLFLGQSRSACAQNASIVCQLLLHIPKFSFVVSKFIGGPIFSFHNCWFAKDSKQTNKWS